MPSFKTPPFNSTEDLIQAVREKRKETGLIPPTCLWKVCQERRLKLLPSERHAILSELASHAISTRKAQKQVLEEERNTIVVTSHTQRVVEEFLPGISCLRIDRPHHWPRNQR